MTYSGIAAGDLNRKVVIEYDRAATQDSHGSLVPVWAPILNVPEMWAQIEQATGKEWFSGQQIVGEITTVVTMRYRSDLTRKHRLKEKDTTRILEIIAVSDPNGMREHLVVGCRESK